MHKSYLKSYYNDFKSYAGAKALKAAADAPDRAARSCSALTTLVHAAAYLMLMELDRPARMRKMREDGGA